MSDDDNSLVASSSEACELKMLQDEKKRLENMISMLEELSAINNLIKSIRSVVAYKKPLEGIIEEYVEKDNDRLDNMISRLIDINKSGLIY